jgi:hypothetical protein
MDLSNSIIPVPLGYLFYSLARRLIAARRKRSVPGNETRSYHGFMIVQMFLYLLTYHASSWKKRFHVVGRFDFRESGSFPKVINTD